jgi:Fe-S-cluster containining protein
MQEPELLAVSPDEPFQFGCGPGVACFNQCCQDLNQALTPYDVLQLRTYLKLSWHQLREKYVMLYTGPSTGLPVASLRFSADRHRRCPFVTAQGCRVYPARPTSCRLYPVARAIQRSRADGRISEHFALLKENHCRGFEKGPMQTVRQWIQSQEAQAGLAAGDAMMELIALKNRLRPGPLAPEQQQWAVMAFYDLDRLKAQATANRLPAMQAEALLPLPDADDDSPWLSWATVWLRSALFGKPS